MKSGTGTAGRWARLIERQNPIPPYISYRTFRNFLVQLESQGLPSRIDRSVLAHKSGTVQSQLLLAFRFLGLIRRSGKPTDDLKHLLKGDQDARMAHLRSLVERSYPFVFGSSFDVGTATSDQAEELFRQTGASGETLRRCLSFFVSAARESGIPISAYIKPHQGKPSSASRQRPTREEAEASTPLPHAASPKGSWKTVRLGNGGTVRLHLDVDLFELEGRDRELVLNLIDRIQAYEKEESAAVREP